MKTLWKAWALKKKTTFKFTEYFYETSFNFIGTADFEAMKQGDNTMKETLTKNNYD